MNTAFSYQITASNFPTSYAASGLPAGLGVNAATGLCSGIPTSAGTSNVTVTATNLGGSGNLAVTLTVEADGDGDGMGDSWEALNGLNNTINDAASDKDGDGQSNIVEWLAGTVPNNPNSRFVITAIQLSGIDVAITWASVAGKRYRVFTRTDLTAGIWAEISTLPITATGASSVFTHTGGGTGSVRRFYRIAIEP